MKRKITFSDKLRIFKKWMKQVKDYGLVATCSQCQSVRINRISSEEVSGENGVVTYKAKYECMNCRATAECIETWNKVG